MLHACVEAVRSSMTIALAVTGGGAWATVDGGQAALQWLHVAH